MSRDLHGGGRWPGLWRVSPVGRVPLPSATAVAAAPLLAALHAALDGQAPPCAVAPAIWTSSDPDDLLVAAEGCTDCPARRECGAYAIASGATCGTWAGRDMTVRDGRRHDDEMERTA